MLDCAMLLPVLILLVTGCLWISDLDHADRLGADDDTAPVGLDSADTDTTPPIDDSATTTSDDSGSDDSGSDTTPPIDADHDGFDEDEDCDDNDAAVHPGVEEVCADGIDNDCDGLAVGCPFESENLAYADARIEGVEAGSYVGGLLVAADFEADGNEELVVSAIGFGDNAGAVYVLDVDSGGVAPVTTNRAVITGEVAGDDAGWTAVADLDDDGALDLIVGAPGISTIDGGAFMFSGTPSGDTTLSAADASVISDESDAFYGEHVHAGDLDGDGVDDMVARGSDRDSSSLAIWVVQGPLTSNVSTGDAMAIITSANAGGVLTPQQVLDVNGDGLGDLLAGDSAEANGSGAAYVVLGPLEPGQDISDSDLALTGEAAEDRAGVKVVAGDLDGDGEADLVVGAYGHDGGEGGEGTVYVLDAGAYRSGSLSLEASDRKIEAVWDTPSLGSDVQSPYDFDGDAVDSLPIGAPSDRSASAGALYIFDHVALGTQRITDAEVVLVGQDEADSAGDASAAGDFDGDGVPDLAVGAPAWGAGSTTYGAVYAIFGLSRF